MTIPVRYAEALKCPNCGASVSGDQCEYCDTWFRITEDKPREDEHTLLIDGAQLSGIMTANEIRELIGLKPIRW